MDAHTIAVLIAAGGALGIVVWVLARLGRALIKIAEALAAAAVVLITVWMLIKAVVWALRQVVTHWRTSLALVALGAWWHWWGSASLLITGGVVACLAAGWRLADLTSFDAWAGRYLRSWWLRWTIYSPKLPRWLQACGLGIKQDTAPMVLALTPLPGALGQRRRAVPAAQLPTVVGCAPGRRGMRSGSC